jgi:hypothetical protein
MAARGFDGSIRLRAGDRALDALDWSTLIAVFTTIAGVLTYARIYA